MLSAVSIAMETPLSMLLSAQLDTSQYVALPGLDTRLECQDLSLVLLTSRQSICTGLWLPAGLERALSERLHTSGWDFILRGELLKHKGTVSKAVAGGRDP